MVKLTMATIPDIQKLQDYGFSIEQKAQEQIEIITKTTQQRIIDSAAHDANIMISGLGGELLPFQMAGVKYASETKRCFIGDEMGLGKTVQALATIQYLNAYPAVIICPASLKYNWEREAKKWLPEKSIVVLNGKLKDKIKVDIIILNYDILKKWMFQLEAIKPQAVIADESHYIKSYKAQRTEATKKIMKLAPIRLCLTGTPVLNRPQELLSQLQALGRLDELGGFWTFARRYCQAHQTRWGWDMTGAAHLDELNEKLRSICYIRRRKEDVLPELPEKRRTMVEVEIDNRQEYQLAQMNLVRWLRQKVQEDEEFLESIAGLSEEEQKKAKNIRANEAEQKTRNAEELVKIEALKQLSVRGKMLAIEEWIESFLETGEKLVVFAHHREIIEELAQKFRAVKIIGGDDAKERQEAINKFQTDPKTKLIICSLQAGGVGITLTSASNVAFLELGWTPAVHDQAEDRCHRIGQKSSVNAWYLLGRDTIDEKIYQLIEAKRRVVNAVTDGEEIVKMNKLKELKERLIK